MTACRDDFSPRASGAAYGIHGPGREGSLQRLVTELEGTVRALGEAIREEDPAWYRARFEELYDGGEEAFGHAGPGAEARLDAELWFLLDCPLDSGGDTPLHRIRQRTSGRAVELLARSELRAWRIESVDAAGVLTALCPLGTGRARLETVRRPLGELTAGAILVARTVPVGPGSWALLGRAPVVDRAALGDFDALLAVLGSPRGEFWRVHGGVLARAAWAWPEDREHTVDGEIVRGAMATFGLVDAAGALATLQADAELEQAWEGDSEPRLERFNWLWDPPRARAVGDEPGVRYALCGEDAAERPFLARIILDLDLEVGEACLLAPTPSRLALAERLLTARLGDALGARTLHDVDPPSFVPRWKRAGFERSPGGRRAGRAGKARAA